MATGSIVVSVLDVGQGQGTFVEVYDDHDNLTNTLLFDLGSAKGTTTAGGPSIDYIANVVSAMAAPKIDYLSLSHKDRDHVNLLKKMIDAIIAKLPAGKTFNIGKIRYGGSREWYSGGLIAELEKRCSDVAPLNLRHACYNKTTKEWVPIWNVNGVFVYIIIANIPTDSSLTDWSQVNVKDKPDSELANSVSIISSVWWNNNQFFINGDATFVTFQESNKIYDFLPHFNDPKMVTLPHHGSRKTTFGLSSSTAAASAESTAVVDTFAKKISAKTITASADIFGEYKHPSYDVMAAFNKYADNTNCWWGDPSLANKNRHYITAYLDHNFTDSAGKIVSGNYSSFESTLNVFSTLYCNPFYLRLFLAPPANPVGGPTVWVYPNLRPPFPLGVQWSYTAQGSTIKLEPKTNRSFFKEAASVQDQSIRLEAKKSLHKGLPLRPASAFKPSRFNRIKTFI